jgi:hypothetical protein
MPKDVKLALLVLPSADHCRAGLTLELGMRPGMLASLGAQSQAVISNWTVAPRCALVRAAQRGAVFG